MSITYKLKCTKQPNCSYQEGTLCLRCARQWCVWCKEQLEERHHCKMNQRYEENIDWLIQNIHRFPWPLYTAKRDIVWPHATPLRADCGDSLIAVVSDKWTIAIVKTEKFRDDLVVDADHYDYQLGWPNDVRSSIFVNGSRKIDYSAITRSIVGR